MSTTARVTKQDLAFIVRTTMFLGFAIGFVTGCIVGVLLP